MENSVVPRRTAADWEAEVGRSLRALRLRQNRSQADVAREANVSLNAVRALELGQGSRVLTLIQVVRALGREDWLTDLAADEPVVSPLEVLRRQRAAQSGQRRRASRRPARPAQ